MNASKQTHQIRQFLSLHPGASAVDLQRLSGLSQPTLSRAIMALGHEVARLGRARSTRYWLTAPLYGLNSLQSVRLIDSRGEAHDMGQVCALADGSIGFQMSKTVIIERNGLPWPLAPLRREGFLGQLAAQQPIISTVLGADITRWTAKAHLFAAAIAGEDLPGALVVGQPPASPPPRVPYKESARVSAYEKLSQEVVKSPLIGSSAGGDHPKLTALVEAREGAEVTPVIVKYSPPRTTPFGKLWNDLLHAELAALDTLREAGEPVAHARLLEGESQTFFESTRFDRQGAFGRRHVVALSAVHDAFVNESKQHWVASAERLVQQKRLPRDDLERIRLWRAFGQLIANNDMHFGNLSFFVEDFERGWFALAPCYDMLPMFYRPSTSDGGLLTPHQVPTPSVELRGVWSHATKLASAFWQRMADEVRCSSPWRKVSRENARRLG